MARRRYYPTSNIPHIRTGFRLPFRIPTVHIISGFFGAAAVTALVMFKPPGAGPVETAARACIMNNNRNVEVVRLSIPEENDYNSDQYRIRTGQRYRTLNVCTEAAAGSCVPEYTISRGFNQEIGITVAGARYPFGIEYYKVEETLDPTQIGEDFAPLLRSRESCEARARDVQDMLPRPRV